MLVAASTECFPDLPLKDVFSKLVDLEYTNVDIEISENDRRLRPSDVAADLEHAVGVCMDTLRLDVVAYSVIIDPAREDYFEQFAACCKLAKATKVATISVPSAEFGTPFNEEVERLRRLVDIAQLEGIRVGMKSECGRLSENPDTVVVLCDNVKGLGITLDPSHYICGPHGGRNIDKLLDYVYHVHLRDTSKEELQVRVGQGEVEYGRLVNQLRKLGYNRALSADIKPMDGVDHYAELRKIRLLLESLLL